jgi:hypothetical protein
VRKIERKLFQLSSLRDTIDGSNRFLPREDIQSGLAEALRIRGVNLLTTMEAGMIGSDDIHQLIFASENKRSLVSYNKRDFARLHYQWMSKQKTHQGIILSD